MKVILTHEERDESLEQLNEEQQEYVRHLLRRGKRTAFAKALAMSKGIHITDSMSDEDIDHFIDDWVLIDFFDVGEAYMSRGYKCKCGRVLRYVYVVQHKVTGEQVQLGKEHFEEHTMIPADAVRLIVNGMQAIDYELDELLWKKHKGWTFESSFPFLPQDLELPEDIRHHIELKLPLLDSQSTRLRHMIERHRYDRRSEPSSFIKRPIQEPLTEHNETPHHDTMFQYNETSEELDEPIQFTLDDLFGEFKEQSNPAGNGEGRERTDLTNEKFASGTLHIKMDLPSYIKETIMQFIEQGMGSARAISEMLVYKAIVPDDRFVTGKLKIYPQLCYYLDELLESGRFHAVEVINVTEDRIYK